MHRAVGLVRPHHHGCRAIAVRPRREHGCGLGGGPHRRNRFTPSDVLDSPRERGLLRGAPPGAARCDDRAPSEGLAPSRQSGSRGPVPFRLPDS
jgi:hypothetical protein